MLTGLFGLQDGSAAYVSPGVIRVMDLPLLIGPAALLAIGAAAVAFGLALALALPNVPQLYRYREYRRAPERAPGIHWVPCVGWSLVTACAFAISLFGMWQRMEFLYFQF